LNGHLRLLHMVNVRFSLLNMAQRILGVTLSHLILGVTRKSSFDGCSV
jgi:hypothetical protein